MENTIKKVVWTRLAKLSLIDILDYRYSKIPSARKIVKQDILKASKQIIFANQYQKDEVLPQYNKIIVRDYKLLYLVNNEIAVVLNIVCTNAGS